MNEELESFDSFSPGILQGIADLRWQSPMPVQKRVVPVMRRGGDLIVQAVTGSGKTGAFGLPIVERVDPNERAIQALILAPTRELAGQIANELSQMAKHAKIEAMAIYGGTAYGPQLAALERGVPIITGTPGRVLDHLKSGRMKLDRLRVLIFDEADELLSLGFWPDMKELRKYIPDRRQTGLFSATIPERVRSLARYFLTDPEFISLTEGGVRSPEEIEHYHYVVAAQEKDQLLLRILVYEDPDSAIIFCNTRDDVRFLTAFLQRQSLDADMIQGDMSQSAREQVMRRIKAAELRFLVATDVAARGIDISDLTHVISYSTPDAAEIYLHRTGRTGRAGRAGTAISLVSGLDIGSFRSLQAVNRMVIPERPVPTAEAVQDRIAKRVEVHLEHAQRELSDRERRLRVDTYRKAVERLAATPAGLDLLSILVFDAMRAHKAPVSPAASLAPAPPEAARESQGGDDDRASEPGSAGRRRRSRSRRGPGAGGGGRR
jgi:ATP-dependent RNA helicase DeaD